MVRYYEKLCLLHDVYNLGNKEEPPPPPPPRFLNPPDNLQISLTKNKKYKYSNTNLGHVFIHEKFNIHTSILIKVAGRRSIQCYLLIIQYQYNDNLTTKKPKIKKHTS